MESLENKGERYNRGRRDQREKDDSEGKKRRENERDKREFTCGLMLRQQCKLFHKRRKI